MFINRLFYDVGPMMRPQMPQQTGTMHPTNNPMYIGSGGVNVGAGTGAVPGGMSAIGGMHQMQQKLVFPRTNNPRSPNINLGSADGLGNSNTSRASGQNWQQQQLFMQQQQQIQQQQHQGFFSFKFYISIILHEFNICLIYQVVLEVDLIFT